MSLWKTWSKNESLTWPTTSHRQVALELNRLLNLNFQTPIQNVQRRFTKRIPGFSECSYRERLSLLKLPSLELRRLRFDLIFCYRVIFGFVDINCDNFFEIKSCTITRGHPYKIFKHQCASSTRSSFFSERVVGIWNGLSSHHTDFS